MEMARAQSKAGIVSKKELADLIKNQDNFDIERILEIEKETKHDVVAAIKEFSKTAKIGGGKIHLGATSMDIVDNTDILRIKEALFLVEQKVKSLLLIYAAKIEKYAKLLCIGFTHLQPAEPTTVGYRLSFYAQDLLTDYEFLTFVKGQLKGKGIKGAVGTGASFKQMLKGKGITAAVMEREIMKKLGLDSALITTQVYSRKFDYLVLSLLASISQTLSKFAGDLRILQSPPVGEWSEPFGKKQVGSSAMPFKKNPINSEKICSLGRFIVQLPNIALENATLSYLERTLDDSANKRLIIPEGFLALDEMLDTAKKIIEGLVIYEKRIAYNLLQYAPFSASEVILLELVKKGANRQEMHEVLREISLQAWANVQNGEPNPFVSLLTNNKKILKYLTQEQLLNLLDVSEHVGDAPQRALLLVKKINKALS